MKTISNKLRKLAYCEFIADKSPFVLSNDEDVFVAWKQGDFFFFIDEEPHDFSCGNEKTLFLHHLGIQETVSWRRLFRNCDFTEKELAEEVNWVVEHCLPSPNPEKDLERWIEENGFTKTILPVFTYEYKGYTTKIRYSVADDLWVGKIENIDDLINFHSPLLGNLENLFKIAVDDYLDMLSFFAFSFGESNPSETSTHTKAYSTPNIEQ